MDALLFFLIFCLVVSVGGFIYVFRNKNEEKDFDDKVFYHGLHMVSILAACGFISILFEIVKG